MMRSEEELTELECVIDDYVIAAVADGFRIKANPSDCDTCVLAAVGRMNPGGRAGWLRGGASLGLKSNEQVSLAWGFDGATRVAEHDDFVPEMFAMGQRFRERVLAGEYRRQ